MRFLHSVSIGILTALGAHFGQKLYRWFFPAILVVTPLEAQIWFGDTASIGEVRKTRGYFYVDTTATPGNKKIDPRRPWIEQIKPPFHYWEMWKLTAECQNMRSHMGEFKRIRWFVINSEIFGNKNPFQIGYYGYLLTDSMAIYLARPKKDNRVIITHEITHALQLLHGEKVNHNFRRFGPWGCGFNYVDSETADPET